MSAQGATSTHAGQYALAIALEIGGQGFPITSETGTLHGPWSIWSAFDRVAERFKASVEYEPNVDDSGSAPADLETVLRSKLATALNERDAALVELEDLKSEAASADRQFWDAIEQRDGFRTDLENLREEHEDVVREFDVVVDERDAALKRVEDLELKLAAYERAVEGNKVAG